MEPTAEIGQLPLGFVDQTQWRYELIRPLVLFADRTAQQRAQEMVERRRLIGSRGLLGRGGREES